MRLQLTPLAVLFFTSSLTPARARADDDWRVAADTLVYEDTDNVLVVSPQVAVHRALDDDGGEASARAVVDVISAASVDVVSQATARFDEVRVEADLGISKTFGDHRPSFSYRFSREPDYVSHGYGAGWQSRIGSPDTVLATTYAVAGDRFGQAGTPIARFDRALVTHSLGLSLTQALGPETLVRGAYTLTVMSGDMEKPYRFVPLFDREGIDAARADGATLDLDTFDRYRLPERPPENVPDLRVGHAIALRAKRYLDAIDAAVGLDYQLFVDNWGIVAHTVEPSLRVHAIDSLVLGASARLYVQNEADFWERTYVVSEPGRIPRWRTLDRELSRYVSVTGTLSGELELSPFTLYAEGSAMLTRWSAFLFLDERLALMALAGVRWAP